MRNLLLTMLLTILCATWSFGQINQFSNPAAVSIDGFPIAKGQQGALDVIVENNGSDPMPASTFRVNINIDATKMEFVDPATYITNDYPDWSIVSHAGGQLVLVNANGEMSPSESISFSIKVRALSTAPEGLAVLAVRASVAPGKSSQAGNADNSTADDNGSGNVDITAPIPVAINQFSNPAAVSIDGFPIAKGQEGALDVIVENNGSDPMPAGTFRVNINIDAAKMEFVDPATYITNDYPDWSIVSNAGGELILENTNGEMSPSESIGFSIKVRALSTAAEGLAALAVQVSVAPGKSSQAGNADNSATDDNGNGNVDITAPIPVAINQFSNPAAVGIDAFPIPKGQEGALDVIVENNGSDPMPAGTFRVRINIDAAKIEFVDPATYITNDYPDWSIVSNAGGELILENTNGEMSPSESIGFSIKVKALSTATEGLAALAVQVSVAPGKSSQAGNADNSATDDNGNGNVDITDPLPVTLVSFSVSKEGETAQLTWSTTEETNSDRFEIERSVNSKVWNKIGTVKSHGESTTTKNYTFSDATPASGINYYRLKMVDRDATFAYSSLKSVQFGEGSTQISTYPNPATEVIFLKDIKMEDIKEVSIVSMNGVTQYKSSSVTTQGINVKDLSSGVYLVNVKRIDGSTSSHKVLISK